MAKKKQSIQHDPPDWARITKDLYELVASEFPEVARRCSDYDRTSPYLIFGMLSDWVNERPETDIAPDVLRRVRTVIAWVKKQPRGQTADDDLFTAYICSFYEHLFRAHAGRLVLTQIATKSELLENEDYLRQWVGNENYEKALALFDDKPKKRRKK